MSKNAVKAAYDLKFLSERKWMAHQQKKSFLRIKTDFFFLKHYS